MSIKIKGRSVMPNFDDIYQQIERLQDQIERFQCQIKELRQSPVLDSEGEVRIYADLT
jgi:hypothetical protein